MSGTHVLWTRESATLTWATWLNAAGVLESRYEKAAGNETLQQKKIPFWWKVSVRWAEVTWSESDRKKSCSGFSTQGFLTSTRTTWWLNNLCQHYHPVRRGKKHQTPLKPIKGLVTARLFGRVKFSAVWLATKVFEGKTQTSPPS